MIASNLPQSLPAANSAEQVKQFFDTYFVQQLSFPVDQIDAVVGFFKSRGFDEVSANSTAIVLLQQAKLDSVNVFTLLDTLKGLTELQMSAIVAEVLNYNRQKNSALGYKQQDNNALLERRNIMV